MDTCIFAHVINILYHINFMSSASLVQCEDFLLDFIPLQSEDFFPWDRKHKLWHQPRENKSLPCGLIFCNSLNIELNFNWNPKPFLELILNNFWSQIWVICVTDFIYANYLLCYIEMQQIPKFSKMYHMQPWGEKNQNWSLHHPGLCSTHLCFYWGSQRVLSVLGVSRNSR